MPDMESMTPAIVLLSRARDVIPFILKPLYYFLLSSKWLPSDVGSLPELYYRILSVYGFEFAEVDVDCSVFMSFV